MSWFNKNKMTEKDPINEEMIEENEEEKIPVYDKRKFNAQGERVEGSEPKSAPVKSSREIELESLLKAETERREAAESKLVGVQAKFEELKSDMERETQEMRERMRKTLEDRAKQGQFAFLTSLLPVLDNLNLAIDHAEKDSSLELLLGGVKGTARSFEQALLTVGVEPIAAVGTDFNPELHEALDMIPVEPDNDGKITSEYSRGYKFGERLLRPSRVQVGQAQAKTAGE